MQPKALPVLAALLVTGLSKSPALAAPAPAAAQPPVAPRSASSQAARPAVAGPMPTTFLGIEQARTLASGALVLGSTGLEVRYGMLDNLELIGQFGWSPGFRLGGGTDSALTGALATRIGAKYRLIDNHDWSLAAQGSLTASTEANAATTFQGSVPVTWNLETGRAFHLMPDLSYTKDGPVFTMGVGFEQVLNPMVRFILANRTFNDRVQGKDAIRSTFEGGLRLSLGSNWTVDATLATAGMVLSPFELNAEATILGLRAWYGLPSWNALRQAVGA